MFKEYKTLNKVLRVGPVLSQAKRRYLQKILTDFDLFDSPLPAFPNTKYFNVISMSTISLPAFLVATARRQNGIQFSTLHAITFVAFTPKRT